MFLVWLSFFFFFFNDTATTEIYTLSLHDALPISSRRHTRSARTRTRPGGRSRRLPCPGRVRVRSEEHTSELQSPDHLVCRLLLEKKKKISYIKHGAPQLFSLSSRPVARLLLFSN